MCTTKRITHTFNFSQKIKIRNSRVLGEKGSYAYQYPCSGILFLPICNWPRKIKFLNTFSSDLRYSGHNESFRQTVLKRVVGRYKAELSNHLEGRKKMFRTREERELDDGGKRGMNQKDTWFRSGRMEPQVQ
jgi:hypothetical protein